MAGVISSWYVLVFSDLLHSGLHFSRDDVTSPGCATLCSITGCASFFYDGANGRCYLSDEVFDGADQSLVAKIGVKCYITRNNGVSTGLRTTSTGTTSSNSPAYATTASGNTISTTPLGVSQSTQMATTVSTPVVTTWALPITPPGLFSPTNIVGLWVFHGSSGSWQYADTTCGSIGGRLPHILDKKTNDFYKSKYDQIGAFWLGARDEAVEGTYMWEDATPVTGYTDWIDTGLDGGRAENCMVMGREGGQTGWFDGDCSTSREKICEYRIVIP